MGTKKIVKASKLNMKGRYRFEKWRDLNNFEGGKYKGLYKVSSLGRVYSVENRKILKPYDNSDGYFLVALYKNGKRQQVTVHRLVATEFIPNPENKPCIDHKDTNRKNNRASNLKWVSRTENMNNTLTLAKKTNNKFIVVAYCILDNGDKLPLAVYNGLHEAERKVKSYSEGVNQPNINAVLNPNSSRKTCGKIKGTIDTPDITLVKIARYNLEGKKIYWCYLQDYGDFNPEQYFNGML